MLDPDHPRYSVFKRSRALNRELILAAEKMSVMDNPAGRIKLLSRCQQILAEMAQFNKEHIHSVLYEKTLRELDQELTQLAALPVTQLRDRESCPACGQPIKRMIEAGLESNYCERCVERTGDSLDKIIGVVEFGDQ